jgi:hypothetical protein
MTRGDLLALSITIACSSAGAMSTPAPEIWKPSATPAECRQISVEFILLDVSRSMLKGGQFRDLQQQIADSIGAAPACRLMILGTFGLTADVRAAEFMTGKAARQRPMDAVWRQRPTSGATNLDEAAKVVELLAYQLQAAYGRQGEALIVTAYTDNIPSPSPGKDPFSLAGFLARRLNAQHVQVAEDAAGLPPAPPGVRRLHVGEANRLLRPATPSAAQVPAVRRSASPFLFVVLGVALVAGMLLAIYRRRLRLARPFLAPGDTLVGVVITEAEQADAAAKVEVLSRNFRLAAASGLPVTFSVDPNCGAFVVAPSRGIPAGELFCVFPRDDGTVRVEGIAGVNVAGQPLTEKGITVNAREGVVISYGTRSFHIGLLFAAPEEQVAPLRRAA